jgi:hypothetical protein
MVLSVDPSEDWLSMTNRASGVRLECSEGPLVAVGTLDSRLFEKPRTWNAWARRMFGIAE